MIFGTLVRGFTSFGLLLAVASQRDCYKSMSPDSPYVLRIVDGETTEDGEIATALVALRSAPTQPITVRLSVDDPTELRLERTTLVFTPDDWERARVIDVVGVDDAEIDGTRAVRVRATIDDVDPSLLGDVDLSFEVRNVDDESASIVLPERLPPRFDREGRYPYVFRLATAPTAPVSVTVDAKIDGRRLGMPLDYTIASATQFLAVPLALTTSDVGSTLTLTATVTATDDARYAALEPTVRTIPITRGDFVDVGFRTLYACTAGESLPVTMFGAVGEYDGSATFELYASDPTSLAGLAPTELGLGPAGTDNMFSMPCFDPGGDALPRDVRLETRVVAAPHEDFFYTPTRFTYVTVVPAFEAAPSQGSFTSDPPAWCQYGCTGNELTIRDPDRNRVTLGAASGPAYLEQDLGASYPLDRIVIDAVSSIPVAVVDDRLPPDDYPIVGTPTLSCRDTDVDAPVPCGELRMRRTGAVVAVFTGPATARYVRIGSDHTESLNLELHRIGVRTGP